VADNTEGNEVRVPYRTYGTARSKVTKHGSGYGVRVPKDWHGKDVLCLLLESPDSGKVNKHG